MSPTAKAFHTVIKLKTQLESWKSTKIFNVYCMSTEYVLKTILN